MVKTILAATDGSEHARAAVELAADLADKYDAELVVMHVIGQGKVPDALIHLAEVENIVEPPAPDPTMPRAPIPRADVGRMHETNQIHQYIGEKVVDEAESIAKSRGVKKLRRVITDGDPAGAILDAAAEEKADMIVVGSRGLGTLKGLLQGSVSQKVSHLAKCTTISVR